jgi:hypothetical protein
MPKGEHILRTYLAALKEARTEGKDDYEAAEYAEKVTLAKHGRLPEEGQR